MDERLSPPGIDEQRVGPWIAAHVDGAAPPFRYERIVGGRSNLTYAVTDAEGRRFVLRRPPLGTLLATAHDVAREWRIVAALASTPVPVPAALAVCTDLEVNGAPFAVTAFVDGAVLDDPQKAPLLSPPDRRETAFHLIDVLSELHAVDVAVVGLDDLSRHDGYVERQLRRWSKQWAASRTRELPVVDDVEQLLWRDIPPQHGVALVHGDYRFGNCITDVAARRIAAVLDWELCALGDPLADLGHLGIYWHDAASPLGLANDPTSAGGFPSFAELLERYAARSGRDIASIDYYRAFAAWRLAIIGEGVAARHLASHPEDRDALAASHTAVEELVVFAKRCMSGASGA